MLLAIDTCGFTGGVALGEISPATPPESAPEPGSQNPPALWSRDLAGKTFSELLLSTISDLLAEAGGTLENLSGVVVVNGPGSFTGIRIGVSAAKGLAEALGIPVIAISRLQLLAAKAASQSAIPVLDAGRGEFYAGIYQKGVRQMELLATREELQEMAAESGLPVVVCEERVSAALIELNPELVAAPAAAEALSAGVERFRAGAFDDALTLDANYLRRTDREMLARIAEHAALRAAAGAQE